MLFKYKKLILFLILEIISIVLYYSNELMDKIIYNEYTEDHINYIYKKIYDIKKYLNTYKDNNIINKENILLINKIIKLKEIIKKGKTLPIRNFNYHYINSNIINIDKNKKNNFMILDKGYESGIKINMGVISPQCGIIGIVVKVSKNFCKVISILNTKIQIKAKIKNSKYFGNIYWDGVDVHQVVLINLPEYVKIKKGEIIETSGKYSYFPEGIKIGKVVNIIKNKKLYKIIIQLYSNIYKTNHVYIVKNKYNTEIEKLKNM